VSKSFFLSVRRKEEIVKKVTWMKFKRILKYIWREKQLNWVNR